MTDNTPTTRAEAQALEDITTGPGFVARSRKAIVAGVGAVAAYAGPTILAITADGRVDLAGEVVPAAIIAAGIGLAAGAAVWATSNAA